MVSWRDFHQHAHLNHLLPPNLPFPAGLIPLFDLSVVPSEFGQSLLLLSVCTTSVLALRTGRGQDFVAATVPQC